MNQLKSHNDVHRRISRFVDWIKTDKTKEEEIRTQANHIRERIKGQAEKDGLIVRSTPNSGSFAKRTGLRRYMMGNMECEGQDVDLPFVVSPKTRDKEELDSLLGRFLSICKNSFPQNTIELTKSSVEITFQNSKLSYDLVPMLATGDPEKQILLRKDGERRETSVQKHIDFTRRRTDESNQQEGRVKFNELVRLFKWWRIVHLDKDDVPSIVLDLLCAKAYDMNGVAWTYPETLAKWFGTLGHVLRNRIPVYFSDFQTDEKKPILSGAWSVIDPVNPDNNITDKWNSLKIDELAEKLEETHDGFCRAIACSQRGDMGGSLLELVDIFGTPFRTYSKEEQ